MKKEEFKKEKIQKEKKFLKNIKLNEIENMRDLKINEKNLEFEIFEEKEKEVF